MKIPSIFVGCGPFGLQRLRVLIENTNFLPVACVDKNTSDVKKRLKNDKVTKKLNLHHNVFPSIGQAIKNKKAKVCFIFVAADQHANLITQSLKNNLHTYCVKPIAINKKEFKSIYLLIKKKKTYNFFKGTTINGMKLQFICIKLSMNKKSLVKS